MGATRRQAPLPIGRAEDLHDLCDDTVGCMSRLHRRYGGLVAFPNGPDLAVFACGAEANQAVLSDPSTFHFCGAPGPRGSAQRLFTLGLFGLNGATQQQHRRLLLPALSKPAVGDSAAAMAGLIDDLSPQFGPWLSRQPAMEDVSRLSEAVARELKSARAVAEDADVLALHQSRAANAISTIGEFLGARRNALASELLAAVERYRDEQWQEHLRQVDWELFDRGVVSSAA